jgi:hypothetical protein
MLMIGSNFQCVGSNCPPGGYPSPRQQIAQDCAQLRSDVLRLPRVARLPNATASLQLASGFAHVLAGVSTCHAWLAEKTRPLLVRAQTEVGRGLNEISSAVQIIHNLGGA